jgi:hypothetical protein
VQTLLPRNDDKNTLRKEARACTCAQLHCIREKLGKLQGIWKNREVWRSDFPSNSFNNTPAPKR